MVGACLLLLAIVFPGENYDDPRYVEKTDELSIAYLRAIIRVRPGNPEPKLLLAKQQLKLGHFTDALSTLSELREGSEAWNVQARMLAVQVDVAYLASLKPNDGRRGSIDRRMVATLERLLADPLRVEDQARLAKLSLERGKPAMAARYHEKMAGGEERLRGQRLAEAGRWYWAAGDLARASRAYHAATLAEKSSVAACGHATRAVQALVAADKGKAAIAMVTSLLGRCPRNIPLLDTGVQVALGHQDMKNARIWSARRLALAQNDADVRERHLAIELAVQDLRAALGSAVRLTALRPRDPAARRKLAEIALWAQEPEIALDAWMWLADREGQGEAETRAVALARGLPDHRRLVTILKRRARRGDLTRDELLELTASLEILGEPGLAAESMQEYGKRFGDDRRTWETLAGIHERWGDLNAALGAWELIDRRFGRVVADVVKQAELLWRMGAPGDALARLRQVRLMSKTTDADYWSLYAELAWSREATDDALVAYRALWAAARVEDFGSGLGAAAGRERAGMIVARLMILARETGHHQEVGQVGREAWARFHDPAPLLRAMESAAANEDWAELAVLVGLAAEDPVVFEGQESYWILRARLAARADQPRAVEVAYARALALDPQSRAARLGWLWWALDTGQDARLGELLDAWAHFAEEDAELWVPYALGLDRMGRTQQALAYYARAAKARPDDAEWLLGFASALERASRPDESRRLRERVLGQFRRFALPTLVAMRARHDGGATTTASGRSGNAMILVSTPASTSTTFAVPPAVDAVPAVRYAELLGLLHGASAAEGWVSALTAFGADEPAVQQLAFRHHLARGSLELARGWLVQQQQGFESPTVRDRFSLAMAERDRGTLESFVEDESGPLTDSDRIAAERRLGHDDHARLRVHRALAQHRTPAETRVLTAAADELARERPGVAIAEGGFRVMGDRDVSEQRLRLTQPWGDVTFGARLGRTTMTSAPPGAAGGTGAEWDTTLGLRFGQRRVRTELWAGALKLSDGWRPTGQAMGIWDMAAWLFSGARLRLDATVAERPVDTALLREASVRHRLGGMFELPLSSRELARVGASLFRFDARSGERLADGYRFDLTLGHRLWLSNPSPQVFVAGVYARHDTVAAWPSSLTATMPSLPRLDEHLPPWAASAVAGVAFVGGEADEGSLNGPDLRYRGELALGYLAPMGRFVHRLDLSAGWRFLPRHEVGARVYIAADQVANLRDVHRGAELRYVLNWF